MATRSIYHKACPTCATLVEADAKRCSCGFPFGADVQQDEFLPEDQSVQDEELLKEYLDARIGQAVSELEIVQATLANDPKNLDTANRLLGTFAKVRDLRAEIDAQAAKITQARNAARAARLKRGLQVEDEASETTAVSADATEAFRTAQAAKAENALKEAGLETKFCPKCHAVLPQPSVVCFCGYNFTYDRVASPSQPSSASRLEHRKVI
jgi:hypothetical protein